MRKQSVTSASSLRCLICIHRKPQLTSPRLLRGGSFEGWQQSSPAFPGNETLIPYGVNLKESNVDGSWKGKSVWKKKMLNEKIEKSIPTFIFSLLVPTTAKPKLWNSVFFERWQNIPSFSVSLEFTKLFGPGNAFRAQIWKQKCVYKFTLTSSCNITVFSQENFYSSLPLG